MEGTPPPPRYPLRYELLDRRPWLVGAALVIAPAVMAVVLLSGGGSSSSSPQEQAVTRTVDGFLATVADGDESACERLIDRNAPGIKSYLRLAKGVPGPTACGFVGGGRAGALTVDDVEVHGSEAAATLTGSPRRSIYRRPAAAG